MYRIQTMNKIASVGLAVLDPVYFQVGDSMEQPHGILVRSAAMGDYEFPKQLRAIARAGAGVNNIPVDRCSENGIVVFNTPGANANAVKELVLAALLVASRDLLGGANWVCRQAAEGEVASVVEKGKSQFVGPELMGKTLGIIGLGAIGVLVANAAVELGMEVYGYDPYLSVDTALRLNRAVHHAKDLDTIFQHSDYITIHVPYNASTKDTIDAEAISKMKGNVRILNLARGELVNNDDIMEALNNGRVARYVTDFPNSKLMQAKNVIAFPHLGASTPESEENCAVMAAKELKDYLENGNITNSVNMPSVTMERSGVARLCVIHRNVPAMLTNIMSVLSREGINVEHMTNKSRGDYAYTLVDVDTVISDELRREIKAIENVIRVRVLQQH